MRGEVEIYAGDKLLYKEANMLVDGAGELLADIMTVSPSLSGVTDHATSSILDASNYVIQAISFGTSRKALQANAQYMDTSANPDTGNQDPAYKWAAGWNENFGRPSNAIINSGTMAVVQQRNFYLNDDVSSYTPIVGMPTYPDPVLPTLELDGSVSASLPVSASNYAPSAAVPLSSVFPGVGQLVNMLPSAISSGACEGTIFSGSPRIVGSIMGAFPDGSSVSHIQGTTVRFFSSLDFTALNDFAGHDGGTHDFFGASALYAGFFNEVSSMDSSGFVNMVMASGTPDPDADPGPYSMSSVASGLCISGSLELSTDGVVEYSVGLAAGDVAMANCYGGIYHLGLWTIDINKSLREGNTPPFGFSVLNNPRKYRLFARKGFSKNLCYINDKGALDPGIHNYTDLTIKWRIRFL